MQGGTDMICLGRLTKIPLIKPMTSELKYPLAGHRDDRQGAVQAGRQVGDR